MIAQFYAHSFEGKPPEEWQPLGEHLRNVAQQARLVAESFGRDVVPSDSFERAGVKEKSPVEKQSRRAFIDPEI